MYFEWDEAKAASNFRKHGIAFEYATGVFLDRFAVEKLDPENAEHGEDRIVIVGIAESLLLSVVYVERDGRVRLISARRATRKERDHYYRENSQG
ncbi:MAG: BrnT family toxin [Alphaproteobacteria bacterium]|nr:BrnT family toxin [Alphaproteobacteria bacterium]